MTSPKTAEIVSDDTTSITPQSGGLRQVLMLAISLCMLQIGFGIITPIFPYYIAALGVGATELGVLAASFALSRIVFASPLGGLSDSRGRKPVMLAALLGFASANVMYAFAPDIWVMIFARAIEGAVSAGFYPAANAYVSDVTIPKNRGTGMGYLSMGNMVGFVIGPTAGGVMAQFLGIRLPFLVATVFTMGTLMALYVLVNEPKKNKDPFEETDSSVDLRKVFGRHTHSYFALAVALFGNMFAIGILEVAFLVDAVTRFGVIPIQISFFFGIIGIITLLGNLGFGHLSDRIGRKWLIVFGCVISGGAMFVFMLSSNVIGFYLGGAVLGVGLSMRGPTIQALIGDLTDDEAYGKVMGAYGAISNSAYVVGPILGGRLYDSTGSCLSSLAMAGTVSLVGAITTSLGLPDSVPEDNSSDYERVRD
ncbi:MAG: MFS transporter [Candidatus Thorarchaeota archaeon]|nr:MFS transporter [Candidatus Thorarchaeota archaeon]